MAVDDPMPTAVRLLGGSGPGGGDALRAALPAPVALPVLAVVAVVAVLLVVVAPTAGPAAAGGSPPPTPSGSPAAPSGRPLVGVVGATASHLAEDAAAGVQVVTVGVGWSQLQPGPDTFDPSALAPTLATIDAARADGLQVVLDVGLQYPPSWVFGLPGGTRFVDQYGDAFTGPPGSGDDVANAVTDAAVRTAEGTYLAWLGAHVPAGSLLAVRMGGGPLGELRYPDASYAGHDDCFWAYDASSARELPRPGWVPGTGTAAQAAAFLTAYDGALVGYGDWLDAALATDFHTDELVLLPGWGQRPGVAALEVASRLTLPFDEFNQGLDWAALLPSLPDRARLVAYTTYLDAPSFGPSPQAEDPADFVASLARPLGMRTGGENTGGGGPATLALTLHRAESLGMTIVDWMDEAELVAASTGQDPGGPTYGQLASLVETVLGPPPGG